jgi:hypothetical protein
MFTSEVDKAKNWLPVRAQSLNRKVALDGDG